MTHITIRQQYIFPNTQEGKEFADMLQEQTEKYKIFRGRKEDTQIITISTESFEDICWEKTEYCNRNFNPQG